MDTQNIFGQRLYELRHKRRMSQRALEEKCDIPQSSISRWEKPHIEVKQIDINSLVKLANEFGVSVDYLLGRAEE